MKFELFKKIEPEMDKYASLVEISLDPQDIEIWKKEKIEEGNRISENMRKLCKIEKENITDLDLEILGEMCSKYDTIPNNFEVNDIVKMLIFRDEVKWLDEDIRKELFSTHPPSNDFIVCFCPDIDFEKWEEVDREAIIEDEQKTEKEDDEGEGEGEEDITTKCVGEKYDADLDGEIKEIIQKLGFEDDWNLENFEEEFPWLKPNLEGTLKNRGVIFSEKFREHFKNKLKNSCS